MNKNQTSIRTVQVGYEDEIPKINREMWISRNKYGVHKTYELVTKG